MESININPIEFCEIDTLDIELSIISAYEAISNKKLYPGDPVRLFLEALASIIVQQRVIIDFTGKQNLLFYATGNYLDQLVALVGVSRLPASPSRCTVEFRLSEVQTSVIFIPKLTRLKGGDLYFKTINDAHIKPGESSIQLIVECEDLGNIGNGLLPGQIDTLVDPFPYFFSVKNINTSTGGYDVETDEALRKRAYEAPNSYSCAGSDKAYAFWAKTVSSEVGDVSVISPAPGEVNIIAIGKNGNILSEELLQKILVACTAKNVKPLTDKVEVINPELVQYNIDLLYYIDSSNTTVVNDIQTNINLAIEEYKAWQNSKLGRDINPSYLIQKIMTAGAKRVIINSPEFNVLSSGQLAQVRAVNVAYGGIESE